jgi:hypothetical protein
LSRRRLFGNLGLSLTTVVLLTLVLEGGARLLEARRPPRAEVAEYIWDWDEKMPGGFYVMKSEAVGWPPWEEFNGDGLRDRTRPREKLPPIRRVAVLGDSVTLGDGIRPEEAFPQVMEAQLAREGRPVEVMNVALWGWSTRQQRIAWQRIARRYQPDQALLAVCLNDIPELQNNLTRPPRWLMALHGRSAVVRRLIGAEGREIDRVERLFSEPHSERVREAMRRFFEEVRALRRDVEADGASLAVLVLPFRFQMEPDAPAPSVQEEIAAFCEEESLSCLDLLPTFVRLGGAAFLDYDHLSPAGSRLTAETILTSGLLVEADRETPPAGLPALIERLEGPEPGTRAAAARALGALGAMARGAAPRLLAALKDANEGVRFDAARALAAIGPLAADVPPLAASLDSEDPFVRGFAAWSLGNLGAAAEEAVPALAHALRLDDTHVVVAAALARIGPAAAAAVPALTEALASPEHGRRWRAARTLGRIGPAAEGAVPALTRALGDVEEAVRLHAARALGRIGAAARPAAAELQRATGDADAAVRREARQALDRLH